jgi:hypothetical protein
VVTFKVGAEINPLPAVTFWVMVPVEVRRRLEVGNVGLKLIPPTKVDGTEVPETT